MRATHLPSSVRGLLFSFRPCFTAPAFEAFTAFAVGWVLAQGSHTLSNALLAARAYGLWPRHHAGFYRLLSAARWCCDALGQTLFELLLPLLGGEVDVAVDDTLCRRRGPQVFGVGVHRDPTAGTYGGRGGRRLVLASGHSWVVLSIRVPLPWGGALAVPVLFRLYRAKKRCPAGAYRKRTELAREMLGLLLAWLPAERRLHVTGDREYGCRTVLRGLDRRIAFTGALPMNARLSTPTPRRWSGRGRPPRRGSRLPSPAALAAGPRSAWREVEVQMYGRRVRLLLQTVEACWDRATGRARLRVVVTRDPSGRLGDRAYFSTDPSLSAEQVLQRYARRWSLETTFQAARQGLGLEEPRNGWWRRPHGSRRPWRLAGSTEQAERGRPAATRTVPLVLLTYGIVAAWYLAHGRPDDDVRRARAARPWDRSKAAPSFADMLSALRRALWRERISAKALPARLRSKLASLLPVLAHAG